MAGMLMCIAGGTDESSNRRKVACAVFLDTGARRAEIVLFDLEAARELWRKPVPVQR